MTELTPMLEAAGWKVHISTDEGSNTVFVQKKQRCAWISATCRNGGRGVWISGKRVVVPNTKGRGWRERFVQWINSPTGERKMRNG